MYFAWARYIRHDDPVRQACGLRGQLLSARLQAYQLQRRKHQLHSQYDPRRTLPAEQSGVSGKRKITSLIIIYFSTWKCCKTSYNASIAKAVKQGTYFFVCKSFVYYFYILLLLLLLLFYRFFNYICGNKWNATTLSLIYIVLIEFAATS